MTRRSMAREVEIDGIPERLGQLEKDVSAIGAQLSSLTKSIDKLSAAVEQPTNWIGIGGLVGASFLAMIVFVKLITDPIAAAVLDVKGDHGQMEDRFYEHVKDGHPGSVLAQLKANTDADAERQKWRDDQIRLLRDQVKQVEDYAHSMMGVKRQ